MIIGERKPLKEIMEMVAECNNVIIAGCGTCVAVCLAGGEKQVRVIASALRLARKLQGKPIKVTEITVERQCEKEFIEEIKTLIPNHDAIISLACGIGVQTLTQHYPHTITYPGLNTTFIGAPAQHGVWMETCRSCGDCILDLTGGLCPIARCSKSLLNGPCGGSKNEKCEVNQDIDCVWQLIYKRLKQLNKLHLMREIMPARARGEKDNGIPRKIIREDAML